jgi:hypothetical protein
MFRLWILRGSIQQGTLPNIGTRKGGGMLFDTRGQNEKNANYPVNRSGLATCLRFLSKVLPGDYLKTLAYINLIQKPRTSLRFVLNAFYRMDHIYEVLREFKRNCAGKFSILEFGTSDGYAFTKMLYATRYLGMDDRVWVHTFDSFEGMPPARDLKDLDLVSDDSWVQGEFRGRYKELQEYCFQRYRNYEIHKGYFDQTLTDTFLSSLQIYQPILVWIDCDYYSSARNVLEKLIFHIPNGCVIYFDEFEKLNFGSRFTGEARLVHEINHGHFGEDIEVVLDSELSLNTKRVYRFIRFDSNLHYHPLSRDHSVAQVHYRTNDSPLP